MEGSFCWPQVRKVVYTDLMWDKPHDGIYLTVYCKGDVTVTCEQINNGKMGNIIIQDNSHKILHTIKNTRSVNSTKNRMHRLFKDMSLK